MSRASEFKRAYRLEWRLSNQKEAFVKTLFECLGFEVRATGLGVLSERRVRETGSKPDFLLCLRGKPLCYLEVTGDNFYSPGKEKYIVAEKIRRAVAISETEGLPVFFVYLGMQNGRLIEACFVDAYDAYRYYRDERHHRLLRTRWGTLEHFVYIPDEAWRPLRSLVFELIKLAAAR